MVELCYGCEINVLEGGKLSLPERYMGMIDYGVVGIHQNCYVNQGVEANTENLISCMRHPRVFLVSHPDDDHTPLDYEKLVAAAKEYHVALEVNNSSLWKQDRRLNCVRNYETMLALCARRGVPIVVDSDAHDPLEVGELDLARDLLERVGFPEELILNLKTERFKKWIGME